MQNPTNTVTTELQSKAKETEIADSDLETVAGGIGTTAIGMRTLAANISTEIKRRDN
jgi:hypothetical protein